MPGDKDPSQAISICPYCNAAVAQDATQCQSCKKTMTPILGNPYPRTVQEKGSRLPDFGPSDQYVVRPQRAASVKKYENNISLATKDNKKEKKKKKLSDTFESEEFSQCAKPINKKDEKYR